jgi:hypothetical protein
MKQRNSTPAERPRKKVFEVKLAVNNKVARYIIKGCSTALIGQSMNEAPSEASAMLWKILDENNESVFECTFDTLISCQVTKKFRKPRTGELKVMGRDSQ